MRLADETPLYLASVKLKSNSYHSTNNIYIFDKARIRFGMVLYRDTWSHVLYSRPTWPARPSHIYQRNTPQHNLSNVYKTFVIIALYRSNEMLMRTLTSVEELKHENAPVK